MRPGGVLAIVLTARWRAGVVTVLAGSARRWKTRAARAAASR